jgi:hypothetical protein
MASGESKLRAYVLLILVCLHSIVMQAAHRLLLL